MNKKNFLDPGLLPVKDLLNLRIKESVIYISTLFKHQFKLLEKYKSQEMQKEHMLSFSWPKSYAGAMFFLLHLTNPQETEKRKRSRFSAGQIGLTFLC